MTIVPLTLKQANELVARLHRHHKPCVGHRFSLGCNLDGRLVGAVIVGRPVARALDPYMTAEVSRLVTDGTPNACSKLYGAAARVSREMGFTSIRTYILESEPGTSLKASGWKRLGVLRRDGRGWNNRAGRRDDQPQSPKVVWELSFDDASHGRRGGEK